VINHIFDKKTSTKSTISTDSYTKKPAANPYEILFEKRNQNKSKEIRPAKKN
jgi:hypothetical protein